jgi:hypothetical protein
MHIPGSFPTKDHPSNPPTGFNKLQTSNAFVLGGFETINDKVLREMNERAKSKY